MNVAELFVKCLENEGVRYVFGVPGEENEDLLFAFENSSVQFVPCRHEQGAAFIANVWGRLTGKAGVCLSTLGPGATNLITGIADANLDKAPIVSITAQGSTNRLHHESHQYLDIVDMFRPIVKWNANIGSGEVVPEVVRKAFKLAEYEKPGGTHLQLPEDIAALEFDGNPPSPLPVEPSVRPGPNSRALNEATRILRDAKRPLIIAGNGAVRNKTSDDLRLFVDRHHVPVVHTFMGKGSLSARRDESLLTIGLGFKDYVMEAVEQADVVIAVGYDIAEYPPRNWNPNNDKAIIHVDYSPAEVYTNYTPRAEIVGDITASLWELNHRLRDESVEFDTEWYKPIRRRILDDIASYDLHDGDPLTIPGTLNVMREIMDDDALLLSDVGSHKMWIARNFLTYVADGVIISNGLASMGISLPGAIAASLIDPKRQVVAAMGDGGFLMNSQELETAKRLGVNFTVVLFNDNDYGLISWKQQMSKGRSVSTHISNPDFKAYAESFGITAYRPETLSELREQLRTAITSHEMSVVEVPVATAVNSDLIEKLRTYWEEKS